jgi:hypothetical protein
MNGEIKNNMEFDLNPGDDNVVDVEPVTVDVQEPQHQEIVQVSTPKSAAKRYTGHIGIDVSSQQELESEGIVIGDLGEVKMSRIPIERFKASTTKISRIGFISKKVIGVKYHYHDDCGSIVCFNGKCCEIIGLPNPRYLFPVVEYSTDNDGNIAGKKLALRMLSAGEDLHKTILTINTGSAASGGIDCVDLLVTCTDDKYQKLTLTPCGPAAWRMNENIANRLREQWDQDSKFAYMAVARKVDEESFMKMMFGDGGAPVPGTSGGVYVGNATLPAAQDLSKFFDD